MNLALVALLLAGNPSGDVKIELLKEIVRKSGATSLDPSLNKITVGYGGEMSQPNDLINLVEQPRGLRRANYDFCRIR